MTRTRHSSLFWHGVAVLNVLLATGLTQLLWDDLRLTPLLLFAFAVGVSTLAGGLLPGLLAALLGVLSFDYLFLPPFFALDLDLIGLLRVVGLMLVAMGVEVPLAARRLAEQAQQKALAELEERVAARTSQLSVANAQLSVANAQLSVANTQLTDRIAESRRAEEALRCGEARLREVTRFTEEVINSAGEGLMVMDCNRRFVLWNRVMAEKLGYPAELIPDLSADEIFPELNDRAGSLSEQVLNGRTVTGPDLEIQRPDQRSYWRSVTFAPHRNSEGEIFGIIALMHDITGRKQAEQQLASLLESEQAARREAETASRLKDEFLATVSHELRTPLSAIIGWSRMLRDGSVREARVPHALEVIERNAKAQTQLINDLLDVSRIISGRLLIETAPVDLGAVITSAVSTIRLAAEARGQRLEADLPTAPQIVSGDADRLQQIVWNLLANAVKFTPQGGRITISLRPTDTGALISVSDNGQGIAAEFLPRVFDRFSQADSSITRRHGGLGLGLAIVRHLTELHGGTVVAESQGHGAGATFTVLLPLPDRRVQPLPEAEADPLSQQPQTAGAAADELHSLNRRMNGDAPDRMEVMAAALSMHGLAASSVGSGSAPG